MNDLLNSKFADGNTVAELEQTLKDIKKMRPTAVPVEFRGERSIGPDPEKAFPKGAVALFDTYLNGEKILGFAFRYKDGKFSHPFTNRQIGQDAEGCFKYRTVKFPCLESLKLRFQRKTIDVAAEGAAHQLDIRRKKDKFDAIEADLKFIKKFGGYGGAVVDGEHIDVVMNGFPTNYAVKQLDRFEFMVVDKRTINDPHASVPFFRTFDAAVDFVKNALAADGGGGTFMEKLRRPPDSYSELPWEQDAVRNQKKITRNAKKTARDAILNIKKFVERYSPESLEQILKDSNFMSLPPAHAKQRLDQLVRKHPGFSPNDASVLMTIRRKTDAKGTNLMEYFRFLRDADWDETGVRLPEPKPARQAAPKIKDPAPDGVVIPLIDTEFKIQTGESA